MLTRTLFSRLGLAALMLVAGIGHFVLPEPFIAIVPDYLPAPRLLVYISGIAEIAGGLGLLIPATRRIAALGIIALLIAVFPANVHMTLNGITPPGIPQIPAWALWARLPLQALLIVWAAGHARHDGPVRNGAQLGTPRPVRD